MTEQPAPFTLNASYDAVVIGAGLGGLGAGLQLALDGARILVLEQHNLPGGFATSFVRGRFEFEPSLHEMADVGPPEDPGGVRRFFKDAGVDVDFAPVPEAYRLIMPESNVDVKMPFGVKEYADALEAYAPGCWASVTEYLELAKEVMDALTYLEQTRGNPDKKVLMKQYGNFLRTTPYTVDQVTEAVGVPKAARDVLYAYWCYLGFPTSRLSFTIWAAMLHSYLTKGAHVPTMRSHELTSAMVRRIRELGGHVEFSTRVNRIIVKNGKVEGVSTSAGDRIDVNHVISNVSPTVVYNRLVSPDSEAPIIGRQYVNARSQGCSAFVVYLGLDGSPEELGLEDYGYFISSNMDSEDIYDSLSRLEPTKMQATVCLNKALPDCSPPGTSIVSITTLYKKDAWKNVSPAEYVNKKNEIAKAMITRFEQASGARISGRIEEIEVATPQTFARYTGAYEGSVYGYEPEPWDSLIPRAMAMDKEVFIKGLRFCGGNAFRCHGYNGSMMSGKTIALVTLGDMEASR